MSQIPNVNGSNNQPLGKNSALNDLDIDSFLKLMIAELQNQDPLNPLENAELVAQIGQIRSVASTEKLTSTLDSVLLGQNISSATNLIGAQVDAVADDGQRVTGVVERVSVANGQPKLHLDLDPNAKLAEEAGEVGAGEYEYRVVWEDDGQAYAVDPLAKVDGKSLTVKGDDKSILLSNLPVTPGQKQVFRRLKGTEDFKLVGAMADGKKSTFLDVTSTGDLSDYVLTGTPQLMSPSRTFTVSLKNVGEIRPPERAPVTTLPVTPPVTTPPQTDDPNAPGDETLENTDSDTAA